MPSLPLLSQNPAKKAVFFQKFQTKRTLQKYRKFQKKQKI